MLVRLRLTTPVGGGLKLAAPEHNPEKKALGLRLVGWRRFSEKHALGLDPGDHAPAKN